MLTSESSTAPRLCSDADFERIFAIINDAADAYRNVIPADCWHEPYMSREALAGEMAAGVVFHGVELDHDLRAVMGAQSVLDVTLIRHAYVETAHRRHGLGTRLLNHLTERTLRPVLIGTWKAAQWAIDFYEKHGFQLVSPQDKAPLLRRYWTVPERQIETSVVLADRRWFARTPEAIR